MAGLLAHGIWLALILRHSGVNTPVCVSAIVPSVARSPVMDFILDNVRADGGLEDIGERVGVVGGSPIGTMDCDSRTAGHFVVSYRGGCLVQRRCNELITVEVPPQSSAKLVVCAGGPSQASEVLAV